MTESGMWHHIRPLLVPYGVFKRIENRADLGTPDVSYVINNDRRASGWLELKHVPRAPARAETRIRLPHLTLDQVLWQEEWSAGGGRVWTLARIDRSYFLLPVPAIRTAYDEDGLTFAALHSVAEAISIGSLSIQRIVKCLGA